MVESDYIERLWALYPSEDEEATNEVLALADEAVQICPWSAKLWCIRGNLIQLGTGDTLHKLEDALLSYEKAIAVDPKCFEAYEEIGYFYDLVMDDESKAKPFFQRAALLKSEAAR